MNEVPNIKVIKEDNKYVAVAINFPGCIGIGDTESIAVKELGKSIVDYMEKVIKNVMEIVSKPNIDRVSASSNLNKLKKYEKMIRSFKLPLKKKDSIFKLLMKSDMGVNVNNEEAMFSDPQISMLGKDSDFSSIVGDGDSSVNDILEGDVGYVINLPINLN